ncbi:restriction endonuclease subunit S, partial [Streptomyces sp. AC563]|nr:restriction endonuclease subunit S [Streptomyces buecherae]
MSSMPLPPGWAWTRLGDLGNYINGRGFKKTEWSKTGRPIIRIQNLTGSGTSFNHYAGDLDAQHTVHSGDLLVSWAATLGVYIWRGQEAALNQHIFKVEPFINRSFLRHLIDYKIRELMSATHGSGMVHVTRSAFDELTVALPSLAEQHRIVEALEGHLSHLDIAVDGVANVKRRIRPLTDAFVSRITLGLPISINSRTAPSRDSRRLLAGLSSKRFDYELLPDLPHGWHWRRALDICDSISSGSTPKAHLMHPGSGDIPFLKVYNITQDGRIDFTNKPTYVDVETHENQLKRSRVRPGDVLTNIVGPPLGKTAVVPKQHSEWNINQAIVAFRAGPEIHPGWLALTLRSRFILEMLQRTAKATAGQFNVALSTCRELPLPVPPVTTQIELVAQADELLAMNERLTAQVASLSMRSQHLRQALLSHAFTGRLVPQDPTDEPASVLLDRIRAEREAQSGSKAGKARRAPRRPRKAAAADASPPPPPAATSDPATT